MAYFKTKLRPEGLKNIFFETGSPPTHPILNVWMCLWVVYPL